MISKVSACALAATACVARTVVEPGLAAPWTENLSHRVTEHEVMDIAITLPSKNIDELAKIVEGVSDPRHASYGQYLSGAEVRAMTDADPETSAAVVAWLRSHGVYAKVQGSKVSFRAKPSEVEAIFETRVRPVRNMATGQKKMRAGQYSIPRYLEDKIAAVFGLHGLPLPARQTSWPWPSAPYNVNPETINTKYQVGGVTVTRGKTNRQAVAEFQGQNAEQSDLTLFFEKQVKNYQQGDEQIYAVVGENGKDSGTEAALDIQYIMGVAPGIATEFWGYQNMDFCMDLNEFTWDILHKDDVPNVFSVSYGWQGELSQIGCSMGDVAVVNQNLMKIAARGISMIISSGDSGSQLANHHLYPSWPASSPYVTAVGGTRFVNQEISEPEMAVDQFGSGGGFSYDFGREHAQWQEPFVQEYFKTDNNMPPASFYNATGRATPDVSGIAEGYAVYSDGALERVGGTSASAPMFAGLVSLLNEARAAKGKPALGFLNPFLYQNAHAFTDVTRGTGAISRSGSHFRYGWDCTKGWDAATGLGTPIFPKLLKAAEAA